jgi:hypothetical protein
MRVCDFTSRSFELAKTSAPGTLRRISGHFLRPLVHEQEHEVDVRMILFHRVSDVQQEGGLAGARRSDDERALAAPDRAHQIEDARGKAIRHLSPA